MNLFDQVYDLASQLGTSTASTNVQHGMPHGARGFIVTFEPDLNGNMTGNVTLHLGEANNVNTRLAYVTAGKLRTGTVSDQPQTAFTMKIGAGSAGLVRVKFTDHDQPEASYTL